ncbi:MAG: hypothetical protein HY741_28965 [Chloroflexi bacterium]|nr:hypothetical protein [Chloroflexota bacterium]
MQRRNIVVLFIYLVISLVVTYPLATQFTTHVPGTTTWSLDEYGYVWNHWWFKRSLFDLETNPFQTDFLFYPLGTSLVLYAYTLLHVMLAVPIHFAFGIIPASNFTVLFSFVIAAFGMYLFTSYLLRVSLRIWDEKYHARIGAIGKDQYLHMLAAFVAGVVFAFASNRFVYLSLGHYNIVASEWIPFYLLFLFKTLLEPKLKNAVMAGLFAALAMYTETTDGVLLVLLTLAILLFEWRLVLKPATLARIALVGVTTALLFAPLLIPTALEIFNSGYALPGFGHSEKLLVDLNGFFAPTSLHPLNRFWIQELDAVRQQTSRFSDVNTFFVGYATALLALLGFVVFARRNRVWLGIALGFAILALGPLLHIGGRSQFDLDGLEVNFPMPFLIFHYIPLIRENRVPNRYSILVVIALAVLVAYAVWWILSRIANSRAFARNESPIAKTILPTAICGLLSAVLIFEHLALPLPLTDARIPAVYTQIRQDPESFTVLSIPLGLRNSFGQIGAEDTRTQYYQSAHQKFLLSGQIQRNPPYLFEYFQRAPIISSVIALEEYQTLDDVTLQRDKNLANDVVNFFDLRYLVVNPAIPGRPPYEDNRDRVVAYLKQVLPLGEPIADTDGLLAYRINQPPLQIPYQVDFGQERARLYQGYGWLPTESIADADASWATQPRATIYLPLRELRDYTLPLRALPFTYPNSPAQTFGVTVNGKSLPRVQMNPGWREYAITLPANALQKGLNEVVLDFGYVVRPREVMPANFGIGGTGVTSPVDIVATSTSAFGSIKVNDREVSPLKRGYNIAVIDPQTGKVVEVKNFDTGGRSILESRALRDFLNGVAQGMIVAGAIQEDATAMLGEAAAAAIQSLGLETNVRGHDGYTHAFIAVKGKPNGLEQSGEGASAVSVGHNLDNRPLSVALDWFRVE